MFTDAPSVLRSLALSALAVSAVSLPGAATFADALAPSKLATPSIARSLMAEVPETRTQRIRFAPGKDSTTIRESVLRGTRDIYLLNAQQGQTMTVIIASLENNAVFDITAPPNKAGQRRSLKQSAVTWSRPLPATGDYQIVVGTTRGNATYKLRVTIR